MSKAVNRYTALIACSLATLATGVHYVWSILQTHVMDYFSVSSSDASLTFYLFIAVNVSGIIIGGRIRDRIGIRIPVLVGILIYTAGLILSSFVPQHSFKLLYLTYSGMVSFGGGLIYTCVISCAQKWWPEKRGFASGLVVCMLGASTVILTPIISALITEHSLGLMATFRALGFGFFVLLSAAYPFIREPAGQREETTQPLHEPKQSAARGATKRLLTDRSYYLLLFCLMIAPFAYYTINPLMKILGVSRGLSETAVLSMVMATGFASALGRLLFGKACDHIGSRNVMALILGVSLTCILLLSFARGAFFYVLIILLTAAYGGTAGITPVLAVDYYGSENTGTTFGMLMVAVLISSLGSSAVIRAVAGPDGNLSVWNFILPGILAAIAALVARFNRPASERALEKEQTAEE